MSAKSRIVLIALFAVLLISVALATAIGPTSLPLAYLFPTDPALFFHNLLTGQPLSDAFPDQTAFDIAYGIRLPRIIAAALVGAGLATAGTAMQGLFKNSMADPYIIGTSSGSALGAAIAIVFLGGLGMPLFAFVGATAASFMVYMIATQNKRAVVETLLLSGIALSMFFSAILSFIMSTAGESLHQIVFWLMGGFWTVTWTDVIVGLTLPFGFLALYAMSRDLNILSLGEEDAATLGVQVELVKKALLFVSSFITGIAVSIAGSIAFVGLITPHVMRLIVGPDHRILFVASIFAGALLLLWSDTFARTVTNDVVPVGVITSFLGAPFFIYLLRRRMRA